MWDLPGPGLKPVSPALAGGFLTTAPPGKSLHLHFWLHSFWLLEITPLFSLKVFDLQFPQCPVLSVPTLYDLCFLTFPCSQIFCSCCFPRLLSEVTRNLLVSTLGGVCNRPHPVFLCSILYHCHLLPQRFLPFLYLSQWQYIFLFLFFCLVVLFLSFKDLFLALSPSYFTQ